MPFIRTPQGKRQTFRPTLISAVISECFQATFGQKMAQFRSDIQTLSDVIVRRLTEELGEGEQQEWPEYRVWQIVDEVLFTSGLEDVLEAFRQKHPVKKTTKRKSKQAAFEPELDEEQIDPVWSIDVTFFSALSSTGESTQQLQHLGERVRRSKTASQKQASNQPEQNQQDQLQKKEHLEVQKQTHQRIQVRRSVWMTWWKKYIKPGHHPDWQLFERYLQDLGPAQKHHTPDEWWLFWENTLHDLLKMDARFLYLLQKAHQERHYNAITGHHWLVGSGLWQTSGLSPLNQEADQKAYYQRFWMEHMKRLEDPRLDMNLLPVVSTYLQPERDHDFSWHALQHLQSSESLLTLEQKTWSQTSWKPLNGCVEPPGWAWMRLAMVMAYPETPSERPHKIKAWYDAFSTRSLIPSDSMLRQAGRRTPKIIEDMAARVIDNFEATQEAIYQAALNTKWTGTVSLDWGRVRAQGSSIAGRRTSQGVASFIRAIESNLSTQGRPEHEKPVTVSLPLWHLEVDSFLEVAQEAKCVQPVLLVPDLFMQAVRSLSSWYTADPAFFPQANDHRPEALQELQDSLAALSPQQFAGRWQKMSATLLWQRILKQVKSGCLFLVYIDTQKAFEPFPLDHPTQHGIDGVGALPLPPADVWIQDKPKRHAQDPHHTHMPWVMWPAAAVNLSMAIKPDGSPDVPQLRRLAGLGFRMLDNAIIMSEEQHHMASWALAHRSVCLGTIGIQEALFKANLGDLEDQASLHAWVRTLGEAWASAVISSEQELRKERGAAPAWRDPHGRTYDPAGSMERLKISKQGLLPMGFQTQGNWAKLAKRIREQGGHRMSARTLWAPFAGAAVVAGVSHGGICSVQPVESVIDEQHKTRLIPSSPMLYAMERDENRWTDMRSIWKGQRPDTWPEWIQTIAWPSLEGWKHKLEQAALIRPWVDQGVSLTLLTELPDTTLDSLIWQAWEYGVDTVRMERGPQLFTSSDLEHTEKEENISSHITESDLDKSIKSG